MLNPKLAKDLQAAISFAIRAARAEGEGSAVGRSNGDAMRAMALDRAMAVRGAAEPGSDAESLVQAVYEAILRG